MSRALITIRGSADRARVAAWAVKAPFGTRVEFRAIRRSLPQNDRMWAMLTDVARQVEWHGRWLTPTDWKLMFLDALNRETDVVPNLNGDAYVNIGRSSSDLSKAEMSDMIELIFMFGAEHNVKFNDPTDDLVKKQSAA